MHVDAAGWIHVIGGATEPAIGGMARIHQVYHPGERWCRPAANGTRHRGLKTTDAAAQIFVDCAFAIDIFHMEAHPAMC